MITPEEAWKYHVKTALFCDDVRRELYGKDIIIGVYTSNIVVPSFPAQIRMSFWIEYVPPETGERSLHIRMEFSSQKMETIIEMRIAQPSEPIALFAPSPFQFTVLEKGALILSVSEDGHAYSPVHNLTVMSGQLTPMSSPSPGPPST